MHYTLYGSILQGYGSASSPSVTSRADLIASISSVSVDRIRAVWIRQDVTLNSHGHGRCRGEGLVSGRETIAALEGLSVLVGHGAGGLVAGSREP